MAPTTTVPVTAEDLLHLPARITFGTWASDWTLLSLQEGTEERRGEVGIGGRNGGGERWGSGDQNHRNISEPFSPQKN